MVLGCAVAALALPGAVAPSSAQVQEVHLPENLARELDAKNLEYFKLRKEFYYCAIGEVRRIPDEQGNRKLVLVITNLVQPKQDTGITPNAAENKITYWVTHDRCPRNAVADVHNHPMEGQFVFSGQDWFTWQETPWMKYHIIPVPVRNPDSPGTFLSRAAVWYIDGDTARLIKNMKVVDAAGTPGL